MNFKQCSLNILSLILLLIATNSYGLEEIFFSNTCKKLSYKDKGENHYKFNGKLYFKGTGIDSDKKSSNRFAVGKAYGELLRKCPNGFKDIRIYNLCSDESPLLYNSKAIIEVQSCSNKKELPLKLKNAIEFYEKERKNKKNKLKTSCDNGNFDDCYTTALINIEDKNLKLASDSVTNACKNKHANSCIIESLLIENTETKINSFNKLCKANNQYACYYIALLEIQAGNYNKALKSLTPICKNSIAKACSLAGLANKNLKREELAKSYYQKACKLNDKIACAELSLFERKNIEKRKSFLAKACKLNQRESCFYLATDESVKGSISENQKYLKKACNLHHAKACLILASHQIKKRQDDKALTNLDKSCALNNLSACNLLAQQYINKGMHKSSLTLLETSCNSGSSNGCNMLGRFYQRTKSNNLKATIYFRKACRKNNASACLRLGEIERKKNKNLKSAEAYFKKSCSLNYALGCFNLGQLYLLKYQDKRTSRKEKKKLEKISKSYIRTACNMGEATACYFFATSIAKSTKEKVVWHRLGCEYNFAHSCFQYARLHTKKTKQRKDYLKKSCKLKVPEGCFLYGLEFKDQAFLKRSCQLGYKKACKTKI